MLRPAKLGDGESHKLDGGSISLWRHPTLGDYLHLPHVRFEMDYIAEKPMTEGDNRLAVENDLEGQQSCLCLHLRVKLVIRSRSDAVPAPPTSFPERCNQAFNRACGNGHHKLHRQSSQPSLAAGGPTTLGVFRACRTQISRRFRFGPLPALNTLPHQRQAVSMIPSAA